MATEIQVGVNHEQLRKSIWKCFQTRIPLFIWGTTGIGKSQVSFEEAKKIAESMKRPNFFDWNRRSDADKTRLMMDTDYRKSSYIFADTRLVDKDPSDLRGLPYGNQEYVIWKPTLLFKVMSLDGSAGLLFFDEANLAPPSIQGSAYQIILDRCIGELALSNDITILAAGNRMEDRANVFDMAVPLRARFRHVTLLPPSIQAYVEYMFSHGFDDRTIAFLQYMPVCLMADLSKIKNLKDMAVNCPRTWEMQSKVIVGETNIEEIERYTSECVGSEVAMRFRSFLELRDKIDLKDILKNPEGAKKLDLQQAWCLISAVSEMYTGDKKILDDALNLTLYMPQDDFGASLFRMLKRVDEKYFENNAMKCKSWRNVAERFGKYVRKNVG